MAPKPPSTVASKAPAGSTASKAPAKKPAEKAAKTAKKTSEGGEKKTGKKRKIRKETYGSYIYKGVFTSNTLTSVRNEADLPSNEF